MDENIRQKLNRVYGRGFYDGVQAASEATTKEQPMTESKFQSIYRGLTEQAKKVYGAVPIKEQWTVAQIMTELSRTTGQKDHRIVSGCLNSLKAAGLIREHANGTWTRVDVKVKVAATNVDLEVEPLKEELSVPPINMQPTPKTTAKDTTPLERIGGLSQQVLGIIQSLHQLAADIEATAIEVEEQIEKIQKDSARLKQLQELLKGLQG